MRQQQVTAGSAVFYLKPAISSEAEEMELQRRRLTLVSGTLDIELERQKEAKRRRRDPLAWYLIFEPASCLR